MCVGDRPTNFGEEMELGYNVWCPVGDSSQILRKGVELGVSDDSVKARHDRHNVSAGTDTLSLSVYEPIAK